MNTDDVKGNLLLRWLEILNNGYVKPDVKGLSGNGCVRDTKTYVELIDEINQELKSLLITK